MEKVSLCLTLKNESDSINNFLQSVIKQSIPPDEIVMVDGGSSDDTVKRIRQSTSNIPIPLRLIKHPGAGRSKGRNIAISQAKYSIIALTDAGCRLDNDWLFHITKPFKDKTVSVVPGSYKLETKDVSQFAKVAALLTLNQPDSASSYYLASSRSLALRKNAWQKVGGYPEDLNTAEDLVFASLLKKHHFKHINVPDAIVYWQPPKSIRQITTRFYNYAFGDGHANIRSPHWKKYAIKTILLLTLFFLSIQNVIFLLILLAWFVNQSINLKNTHNLKQIPLFKITITVGYLFFVTMIGFGMGIISNLVHVRQYLYDPK